MRRAWVILPALAAAFGITAADAAPPEAELRNCRTRAEGTAPTRMIVGPNDVRLGPLVLGNVRSLGGAGRSVDPTWPWVKKMPVLLPARARVVLAISPEAAERAAFQHRNGWAHAIRFTACYERVRAWAYAGTVGKTTFFPSAIGLRKRSLCLPLELWVDGQAQPLRRVVPIGRRSC